MADCINRSHPDYLALVKKTGLNPLVLDAKISVWQELNVSSLMPSANELLAVQTYFDFPDTGLIQSEQDGIALLTPSPTTVQASQQTAFNNIFSYPIGELTAYKLMKEQMLLNTEDRIRVIDNTRKKNKRLGILDNQALSTIRKNLTDLKSQLELEVEQLGKTMMKSTTVVAPLVEADLERARFLSNSLNPIDLKEAKEITDFISGMAEFVPDKIAAFHYQRHPLYTDDELANGIPDDERAVLQSWAIKAKAIEEVLSQKRTQAANDILNNTTGIDSALTIEQIKKKPLKDTSWVDMMIMDITHGIFSHNGLLPQAMSSLFSSQMEIAQAEHRRNEDSIKQLEPKVKEALKQLKARYPDMFNSQVTNNNPDFSIFFQQDGNNMYSNGAALVDRFTLEYQNERKKNLSAFRRAIRAAFKATGANRETMMETAYNEKFKWIRQNEVVFDPRKITVIRSNPMFASFKDMFDQVTEADVTAHEQEIKNLVGEEEFNSRVDKLTQHLNDFVNVSTAMTNEFMASEGVTDINSLSNTAKARIDRFIIENNPFILANSIITGRFPKVQRAGGWYNIYPKAIDTFVSVPRNELSYDKRFSIIQSNDDTREFYKIAKEISEYASSVLPVELQYKITENSLFYLPKTAKEILFENDGTILVRLVKVLKKMWSDLIATFGMESQSELSYAHKNYITGEQNYQVNASFITKNLNKIDAIRNLEVAKFKTLSGISKFLTKVDPKKLNTESAEYLSNIVGRNVFNDKDTLNVYEILTAFANHQMVMNSSMNLFNILRTYSNISTQYDARRRVLPLIENLKGHYEEIKSSALNNVGQDVTVGQLGIRDNTGQRSRAKSQFESWFNNQVLDNRGIKQHTGAVDEDVQSKRVNAIAKKLGKTAGISFTKIKTGEEKRLTEEIREVLKGKEDLVAKLQDILAKDKTVRSVAEAKLLEANEGIVSLLRQLNDMGRYFSVSTVLRGVQKFLIMKLLGLNISSAATNFLEGQISNGLSAARGIDYPSEYAGFVSVGDLISAGVQKRLFGEGKMTEQIWILDSLIHRYDLFNDVGQELAQSSTASVFDSFAGKFLMQPTRRTEYLNQAPLIGAMLRDTQLTGKDGSITHLFDTLERVEVSPKNYQLKLKENYDTVENRAAWLRDFEGLTEDEQQKYNQPYQSKKLKIDEAIKNAHGDYNKFSNMKIKDTAGGQAFMTMRTWLPRQLYMRFGVEQDDIMLGVQGLKGIARSHTTVTAATLGGLVGLMTGGIGLAAAAAAGLATINYIGLVGKGQWGAKSSASTLQELSIMSQVLFLKMLGRPLNMIVGMTSFIHGKKKVVNTTSNQVYTIQNGKLTKQDMSALLIGQKFTDMDLRNFRTNLTEIANILMMYGLYFAAQLFLGGDDEDEERWNHLMVNRAMQLTKQATTYYNGYELLQQANPNNTAVWKFITTDLAKFLKDVSTPGTTESYGENSGKNKAWVSFSRAFIPGIVQSPFELGFSKSFEKQFQKSPLDKWFWSEEKKSQQEIREIRAKERAELKEQGMTPEEANKALKKKYGKKDKDQTYESYLQEIETIGELPEE